MVDGQELPGESERPVIVVDTTTTFGDVMMTGTRWVQVLSLCAKEQVRLAISTVVLRETAQHWEEQARKALTRVLQGPRSLADLGLGDFPLPTEVTDAAVDPESFFKQQSERLTSLSVEILPLPKVDVPEILQRDLARKKPFAQSGKGFRDVLIWHSVRELVETLPPRTVVFFVSRNTEDYSQDGELHPDLLSEIEQLSVDMRYALDLGELLASDPIKPLVSGLSASPDELERYLRASVDAVEGEDYAEPRVSDVIGEAIIAAATDLLGEEVSMGNGFGSGLDFSALFIPREIETPTITHVETDATSVDWDAYETYEEDTLLVRATIDAEVEIEGFVFKSDYYAIEEDVSVIEFDWNEHYTQVATSVSARLVFQLRVEAGARLVEYVEFETAEARVALSEE